MPTADIKIIRTSFSFDIIDNRTRLHVVRDLEAVRPIRWFIPNDGSDPVACPDSMREAVASITSERCQAPAGPGRPGESLHIYMVCPFDW